MHFSLTTVAAYAALLSAPVDAFVRMSCGQTLVTERADPIISPGQVSNHVHQINGGNAFGFTEGYTNARAATCTSCQPKADLSNYWTPILYYQAQNGSFTRVGQDGMTVYYLQRGTQSSIKGFPEGFRMIAGNPFKRTKTTDFAGQAVSFVCLDYSNTGAYGQTNELPTHACPDGVRAQVFFPSCWDGVNLDSADHSSHMAYPESGSYDNGPCPASHPVQLISLFFEVIFDTPKFDFWSGNYGTGQPFVFSMGDPQGYGFHGDFLNGWDVNILQKMVDTCTNLSGLPSDCAVLDLNTGDEMASCTVPTSIQENIQGPFAAMPGCNPVQTGPAMASIKTGCGATTTISGPEIDFTDMTASGWSYQGCAADSTGTRTLTGTNNIYSTNQGTMDVDTCLKTCAGYTYAGLEYGKQCFCGNSVASDRAPSSSTFGSCNMACAGNSTQICGGSAQLSLYKACTAGSSCTNDASYKAIGNLGGSSSNTTAAADSGSAATTAAAGSSGTTSVAAAAGSSSSTSAAAAGKPNSTTAAAGASDAVGLNHAASSINLPVAATTSTANPLTDSTCGATKTVTATVTVTASPTSGSKRQAHARQHRQHARKLHVENAS